MSPSRPCEYQPKCPGCPRYGEREVYPDGLRPLVALTKRFSERKVEVHSCDGVGHRYRSRLSVRGRRGASEIGIFEAGSHQLVHIPRCPVHHPSIVALCQELVQLLDELGIKPYEEGSHSGQVRAVQFAVEPQSSRVQLALLLLANELHDGALESNLLELAKRLESSTHSVFLGALPHRNNSLLPSSWRHMSGPDMFSDVVGGARVYFPPDAFGQANPIMHARVVDRIHGLLHPDESIMEYYAGVGTIGLGLCAPGRKVSFNEVGLGSLRGLRQGLRHRDVDAELFVGSAGDHASVYGHGDTVIVDPTRKGLDAPLLARFLRDPPHRLVYLSCGMSALMREAAALLETGHYEIQDVSAWAYFPFTEHIETLLVLERIN